MKYLVLALAILATLVSSNHLIHKRITTLVQEGYSVDNVVNLLLALARTTGDNLQTLIDNWAHSESQLLSNIETLESLTAAQEQRCNEVDVTVTELLSEIEKYRRHIRDAQNVIRTNLETVSDRRDKRCAANLIFVQKLKDNQDGAKLLSYLKDRIADPSFQDYLLSSQGSLAEIRHSITHKKSFALSVLAKHHMLNMLQQSTGDIDLGFDTQARTQDEIGTGQVDNDQGAIHLSAYTTDTRDLENFISELLGFIDQLIAQLAQERHELQAAEFQSVEDLIDYQSNVEHQNLVLSTYIELWTVHIAETSETLAINQVESQACHERAELLAEQLEQAVSDYQEKEVAYEANRKSLEGTLAALQEVIQLYVQKVVNAPAVYLEQIDAELARAQPVEPEHVDPLTPEERAEVVSQFEADQKAEEARALEAKNAEIQSEREQAALEREAEAVEGNIEQREAERLEEIQQEAEPVVQELSETDLANEEADLEKQAAAAESEIEDNESEASEVSLEEEIEASSVVEEDDESVESWAAPEETLEEEVSVWGDEEESVESVAAWEVTVESEESESVWEATEEYVEEEPGWESDEEVETVAWEVSEESEQEWE